MQSQTSREAIDFNPLGLILKACQRAWLPAACVFILGMGGSVLAARRVKPVYEAGAKILFRIDSTQELTGLARDESDNPLRSLLVDQSPISNQMEILLSEPLLERTIKKLDLRDKKGEPLGPGELKTALEVKIIGATDVVSITYVNESPELAAAVVNSVIEVYRNNNVTIAREDTVQARIFLSRELPQVEKQLRNLELRLQRFKEQNQVINLEEEARTSVLALRLLDEQITNTEAAAMEAAAKTTVLRRQLNLSPQEAVVVAAVSQSPSVQKVLLDLQDTQKELAEQRSRFTDSSPTVSRLMERERQLQDILQKRIQETLGDRQVVPPSFLQAGELRVTLIQQYLNSETERVSAVNKLKSFEDSRSTYLRRSRSLPKIEQEQRYLERKLKAAQGTYETLLSNLQTLLVKEEQRNNSTRILEPATVPRKPSSGGKVKVLALGLFGSTLMASAIIIIAEVWSSRSRSEKKMS
ncbi:GumC family protein [Limnothrix redekei]|uniref:GNVR domain-containing protein n=1 Tax=Limnothrix redekei LRLZ20PSL1 TaxID=3112953 RepID=A0ABW7C5K2_9CYAN